MYYRIPRIENALLHFATGAIDFLAYTSLAFLASRDSQSFFSLKSTLQIENCRSEILINSVGVIFNDDGMAVCLCCMSSQGLLALGNIVLFHLVVRENAGPTTAGRGFIVFNIAFVRCSSAVLRKDGMSEGETLSC